jgi:ABC-type Fe3+/spermidine/putrescine transport system ATPase subunit
LRITDLTVRYRSSDVLSGIDLVVGTGELVALLGPSGAGKSTLLNAIAGLVAPSAGEIALAGTVVAGQDIDVVPERRDIGLVFQNYALWPHLSARDTVGYPMRRAGLSRAESDRAALELLRRLGIEQLADRKPAELSGGEQQRVGLARALAREPRLYLLDEPTAHLDTQLRATFQAELRTRQLRSGAAGLCATHDPAEALAIADRIALISGGRLVQVGTPTEVYERPVSAFAAQLTGAASILRAPVFTADHDLVDINIGDVSTRVAGATDGPLSPGVQSILIRPEWTTEAGPFAGAVTAHWFRGPHTDYLVRSAAGEVLIRRGGPPTHAVSEEISWGLRRAWVIGGGQPQDQPRDQPQLRSPAVSQPNAAAMPR